MPNLNEQKRRITYYAIAKNAKGKIEQLFVVRIDGKQHSQEWTGKIYRSTKEAEQDLIKLNCKQSGV